MNINMHWQFVDDTPVLRLELPSQIGLSAYKQLASVIEESLASVPLGKRLRLECCRAVPMDALARVLAVGIDVDPPDAPIYVGSLEKAMEYGGWPKLVAVLDIASLTETFCELGDDASEELVARTRGVFATEVRGPEGTTRWFSRLPANDPRVGSAYEIAYARWIPGVAREALLGVLIIEHTAAKDLPG